MNTQQKQHHPHTFTDANFDDEVLKSQTPVLVDFWAEWCQPCLRLAETIAELSKLFDGRVKVGKLDVDANPNTAQKYGIRSIPSVLVINNGEVLETIVGVNPKQTYIQALEQAL